MLSIVSWNCQGNPIEDDLAVGFLQRLLTDHAIVVLQSCGSLVGTNVAEVSSVTIGRIRCHSRGMRQPISVDPFCSTAILSRLGSDYPLEDAEALEIGRAGRFGVACRVPLDGQRLVMVALHAAVGGFGSGDAIRFAQALRTQVEVVGGPMLIAAELGGPLGAPWPGIIARRTGASLVDNRGIAHPSPGHRHDSFMGFGVGPAIASGCGVIDAGGASDHDAVYASFGL